MKRTLSRSARARLACLGVVLCAGCVAFGGNPGDFSDAAVDGSADDGLAAADRADAAARDASIARDAGPPALIARDAATRTRDARAADARVLEASMPDTGTPADAGDAATADASLDAGTDAAPIDAAPTGPASLELGTSVIDGSFTAFIEGDDIPINSAGQSGVVLDLALRTHGMREAVFLTVTVTPQNGEPLLVRQPGIAPNAFSCSSDGCDLIPFRVVTSALGEPIDVLGLVVTVDVLADDGAGTTATATFTGALRPP